MFNLLKYDILEKIDFEPVHEFIPDFESKIRGKFIERKEQVLEPGREDEEKEDVSDIMYIQFNGLNSFYFNYHFKKNCRYFYGISIEFENEVELDYNFTSNFRWKNLLKKGVLSKQKNMEKVKFLLSLKFLFYIYRKLKKELDDDIYFDKYVYFNFFKLNFVFFNNLHVMLNFFKIFEHHAEPVMNVNFTSINNKYFSKKKRAIKKNRLSKIKKQIYIIKKDNNTKVY